MNKIIITIAALITMTIMTGCAGSGPNGQLTPAQRQMYSELGKVMGQWYWQNN